MSPSGILQTYPWHLVCTPWSSIHPKNNHHQPNKVLFGHLSSSLQGFQLVDPPDLDLEEDLYQTIKDHLISLYGLTNYQRFETLIDLPMSIDITPSILMSSMLNLYSKGVKPDFVFRGHLFFFPAHLLDLNINDNNALAKQADTLCQSQKSSIIWQPTYHHPHSYTSRTNFHPDISKWTQVPLNFQPRLHFPIPVSASLPPTDPPWPAVGPKLFLSSLGPEVIPGLFN